MNEDPKMPWPAPSLPPASSTRKKWWWRAIGTVIALMAAVVVYSWLHHPVSSGPVVTVKIPSTQSAQSPVEVAASDQDDAEPLRALPPQATARPSPAPGPAGRIQPKSMPPAIQPRAPAASTPPAPLQLPQIEAVAPRPMAPPAGEPLPMTAPSGQTSPPAPAPVNRDASPQTARNDGTVIRNDPRIDLQALVWAPEASDRFVVINNRLIKEGGSVDNIVVVQINRDDVLLSEGADRWHQAFQIR